MSLQLYVVIGLALLFDFLITPKNLFSQSAPASV